MSASRTMDEWQKFLASRERIDRPPLNNRPRTVTVADVFCSVGGLTLGVTEAIVAQGKRPKVAFAADVDAAALAVYRRNFPEACVVEESMDTLVQLQVQGTGENAKILNGRGGIKVDSRLLERFGGESERPDVLLAGPPCQGHSMLNNHTRYDDPRNRLYLTVPALAIKLGIPNIIIENVPGVLRDKGSVAVTAESLLKRYKYKTSSGELAAYKTSSGVLAAHKLGWPQTRKRFFLIASLWGQPLSMEEMTRRASEDLENEFGDGPLPSVMWALDGIPKARTKTEEWMQAPPNLSAENVRRIRTLVRSGALDMPLDERPPSHSSGTTYMANYGRMDPEKPAPTLTTGYATPGRGRFIHPTEARTLNPREAARIQGFPDWFSFEVDGQQPPRTALNRWIGNAVPSILGFHAYGALPKRPKCW